MKRFALKTHQKLAVCIFVFFSGFYIITQPPFINTPDGVIMAKLTRSIWNFKLHVEPIPQRKDFGGKTLIDPKTGESKLYPWFGPTLSFVSLPSLGISKLLYPFTTEADRKIFLNTAINLTVKNEDGETGILTLNSPFYENSKSEDFEHCLDYFFISWTNCFLTAGILVGIFYISKLMHINIGTGLLFTSICGVATPLWHYGGEYFSEPMAAFTIIWGLYTGLKGLNPETSKYLYISGVLLGLTLLTKAAHIVMVIPYALLLLKGWKGNLKEIRNRYLKFFLPATFTGSLYLFYNFIRFNNPFETGYGKHISYWSTPFLKGAYGLLFSNGRGLFIYTPLLILTLAGLLISFKKKRHLNIFSLVSLTLFIALYAKWYMWEGGWCWGPRFFIPILPVLLLPALNTFNKSNLSPIMRILKPFTIISSFTISISGVIVNYAEYSKYLLSYYLSFQKSFLKEGIEDYYELLLWDPLYSPLIAHWTFPFKNRMLLNSGFQNLGIITLIYLIIFIVMAYVGIHLFRKRKEYFR